MDALSQLIRLTRVQGSLDLRCQMAGTFAVEHDRVPAGEAPFHLVLAGCCVLEPDGGAPLKLAAGDLVLLPHGHAHRVREAQSGVAGGTLRIDDDGALPTRRNSDGPADLDLLCGRFHVAPGTVGLLMTALPDVVHVSLTSDAGLDELRALIALMRAEVQRAQPGALAIVTALSQALFVMALRAHVRGGTTPACLLALLVDARLGRSVQAMLRDPARDWSVESLAAEAAMSRATYARRFHDTGGLSPWDLLTRLRMHVASDLLLGGREPIGDVAARVGYRSEAAFGKVFRAHMGLTPARFRRERRRATPPAA